MKWNDAFTIAETYYHEHGNLLVPKGCISDGLNLYSWISRQRHRYSLIQSQNNAVEREEKDRPLTEEQINALESIGMIWNINDYAWERAFALAQRYYKEHGNLIVPKNYEEDGINLSHWVWTQRRIVNGTKGVTSRPLTEEQIRRLEEIGMVWAPKSKGFSYYYGLAKKFYDAYGHTDFPEGEVMVAGEVLSESGENLAAWKREQEHGDFLEKKDGRAKEKLEMLHEIGMCLDYGLPPWERKYRAAEKYYREHGDLLVPFTYITEDGIQLGKWISNQRIKRRGVWGSPPTEEQIHKLDAIGMSWDETKNRGKRGRTGAQKKTEDDTDQAED